MALNEKIFVLREDVEYPDGANIIEIVGTGDERDIPRYPTIVVGLAPLEVISNGLTSVKVEITVRDYNSSNPFEGTVGLEESASADDSRFEFSTSGQIRYNSANLPILQVWEDQSHTIEITDQIEAVLGSRVKLSSDFRSAYADPGNTADRGLIYQKVWYRMDTGPTLSLSVGSQQEEWWELNPDGTSRIVDPKDQGQVSGKFYYDAECTQMLPDSQVLIPISTDQRSSVTVYFRPETGDWGTALINVAYGGLSVETQLIVTSAIGANIDANLDAEPTTVQIKEKSLITLYLDTDGVVLNDINVNFFLLGDPALGPQGTLENSVAITQEQLDKEDFPRSSEGNSFTVKHNIVRIKSIRLEPELPWSDPNAWAWDPNLPLTINGNSVELHPDNVLPLNEMNLRVVYDTGGYASCVYIAPDTIPIPLGAQDPKQVVTIVAQFAGTDRSVDVTVTPATSLVNDGLSMSAESPVGLGAPSSVTVWHNEGSSHNGGVVDLNYWPPAHGSGPSAVILGTLNIVNEEQTTTTRVVVGTEYPINPAVTPVVKYWDHDLDDEISLPVDSVFDINQIQLTAPGAPVAGMPVKITYQAIAIAQFDFVAPLEEMDIYIGAEHTTGLVTEYANAKVEVSLAGSNGLSLSLEPVESTLPWEDPDTLEQRYDTIVKVSCPYFDEDTGATALHASVSLIVTPTGCGLLPGSCVLGDKELTETEIRPSDIREISTQYLIKAGTTPTVTREYDNYSYTVVSTLGNKITVSEDFLYSFPPCEITYMATAYTEVTYNASGAYKKAVAAGSVSEDVEDTDAFVYLGGKMVIEAGTAYGNCDITLNDPLADVSIDIEASESTIYKPRRNNIPVNSEWRVEETEDDDHPIESVVTVEIKIGEIIAPEGTEYTLYVFSRGLEPADDTYAGEIKTGGKVAGSIRTLGPAGTDSFIVNARNRAIDTYIFKAVIGQASADTSVEVQEEEAEGYLTYDIPVMTIVGWRKATSIEYDIFGVRLSQSAYEFCSSGAKIIDHGALNRADDFNGVVDSPEGVTAADTSQYLLIGANLPAWVDPNDVEKVSISGATVIQPMLRWGSNPGEIESGYSNISGTGGRGEFSPGIFAVKWNYSFNKYEWNLNVRDYVPEDSSSEGAGVYGSTVTVGTQAQWNESPEATWVSQTDKEGNALFYKIPPGTYDIFIASKNHKDNRDPSIWEGMVQSIGIQDNISSNDQVTVPEGTMRPYILTDTDWSIDITATVKQRTKYDALAVQSGWTPDAGEALRIPVRGSSV